MSDRDDESATIRGADAITASNTYGYVLATVVEILTIRHLALAEDCIAITVSLRGRRCQESVVCFHPQNFQVVFCHEPELYN